MRIRADRSRCSSSFLHHSTHTAPFPLCRTSYAEPTVRGGLRARALRLFLVRGSHPLFGRPFFVPACSSLRGAPMPARPHPQAASALRHARSHARTRAHGRPTTNDATCGPPAWLTGTLHEGEYGAYAHRCGEPLSLRPLSPRPCKAAAPKGPAFCFLNY